jgi:hypothetical protein
MPANEIVIPIILMSSLATGTQLIMKAQRKLRDLARHKAGLGKRIFSYYVHSPALSVFNHPDNNKMNKKH